MREPSTFTRSLSESGSPASPRIASEVLHAQTPRRRETPLFLYGLTIFFSAFLLFQVQPVMAKMILAWFGGSAAVWTTCLLFFQSVLLAGYLYAHLSVRYLGARTQVLAHVALLAASVLLLPVIPDAGWKPAGAEDPVWRILGLLLATLGLPYFLLSTTSPMLQAWYARTGEGAIPYRLFALSNAGSMLALVSYPVLVEPFSATRHQAWGWSAGYLGFVVLCSVVALGARGRQASLAETGMANGGARPSWKLHLMWLALAACASTLLLAVTNHLTQNVASIPFLWILPLALYLLSFILCFEGRGWYRRPIYLTLAVMALGGMAYALDEDFQNLALRGLIPIFAGGLFVCAMVCHGELARGKPAPRHLTSFYLMVALGGALGGVLAGLVAPHLFSGYFELPLAMGGCGVVVALALRAEAGSWVSGVGGRVLGAASMVAAAGLMGYLGYQIREFGHGSRLLARNFYGGLRVSDDETTRKLTHGTINHGEQFLDAGRRMEPTTYYGRNTGIGLALRVCGVPPAALRVGVIGLGTGTLAAYGRPGDTYRFYEINPLVIGVATSEFSFLRDSKAHIEVALGDARLSLEREAPQGYDLLAVDAFSGDAIPVHLLTREAFVLYFRHLRPGGLVAVHVSNKHLRLAPVVELATEALGKKAWLVDTDDDDDTAVFGATWVLVTERAAFFEYPAIRSAGKRLERESRLRMWTDDYSNLFQILK